MSHDRPGALRRLGLALFRLTPSKVVWPFIRIASPTFTVGAVALIEYDGKLLALRQTHRSGVSLPGGLVEKGEHPTQSVTREVMEETGIRIDPGDVIATTFETKLRHIDVLFRVVCDREPEVRVASEATGYEWLPLDDWTDIDKATARVLHAVRAVQHEPRPGSVLPADG
ncbi:MAG TPA: NUDIX domain-containing protein [Flexivirga sp.]|uniref:NUDIX hydrolase n=1 Tax=Flexivirga sp. TaxID=1962927 RepID=UPI002CBF1922|nr:NUDIX domain-containing protein [Flexivirga sp.]HWC21195.1 NUDIX domain-containing protein [Flexivirga sp.]